jgi:hypothetical protein
VVKTRAFVRFFGRFSTVQQYPDYVFAPINSDSPPKSSKKNHQIPVFHIPDSRRPFIILRVSRVSHNFTFHIFAAYTFVPLSQSSLISISMPQ